MNTFKPVDFKPTDAAVRLAESVMVAMAHEQMVRPVVEGYQKAILEKRRFRIDPRWVDKGLNKADEVILDLKHTLLMSDEDFKVYVAECDAAREAAGLKVNRPGDCPLLVAEHMRIKAENALLEELGSSMNMKGLENILNLGVEARGQAVDLCLKLLAPYCRNASDILGEMAQSASASPAQRG